jgi:hypothetical protein
MATVRPEFGPTLRELLTPRWRTLARWQQRVLQVAGAAIVVLALAMVIRGSDDGTTQIVVRKPLAFNLIHTAGLERVTAHSGEILRLESDRGRPDDQSFTISPLRLPPYRGDVSAGFLIASARIVKELGAGDPGFVYRGEGRARINQLPGYQVLFATKRDGKTVLGRRVLLVPDEPGARDGVDILLLTNLSKAVPNVDAVGNNGLLKTPLRSFRFGTERP